MKVTNRQFDFDGGALLNDLECAVCEGPLSWDFQDDFGSAPSWTSTCCNISYELKVKSVRASSTRE